MQELQTPRASIKADDLPPPRASIQADDLQLWMKPRPRQIDIAPLAILLICLALSLPLMTRAGLPASPNARSETARITAVEDNLRAGIFYARWAQHFHYGYGSPLPNYLAPLPYFAGGLTMIVTQSDAVISLKILLVGDIFLAGFGMFFAVRRLSGSGAMPAFLAALVYLLAPTTVYHLALTDITLPFLTVAAIFPWVLWAGDRLLATGDGRDFVLFALVVGLLVMSANLMGPLLLMMAMFWLVWRFLIQEKKGVRARWWMLAGGLMLGIGLAAIYWLPAIIEWGDVRWLPAVNSRDSLSVLDVIRPVSPSDFDVLNVPEVRTPGLAALILGVVGLRHAGAYAGAYRPFAVMGLILLVAALIPGGWLDDAARFPELSRSDLLLPLTACCALLAASAASALERFPGRMWMWTALLALGTLAAAYPILGTRPFIEIDASRGGYLQAELDGSISGSFRNGQLLPTETNALPAPSPALTGADVDITKIARAEQMPRANLAILQHSPTHDRLRVNLPGDIGLDVLTLHFPGWQARYQGGEIPLERVPETGLLRVEVPAGGGLLDIYFGTTTARTIGMLVTITSVILIVGLAMAQRPMPPATTFQPEQRTSGMVVVMGGLAALMIVAGQSASPQTDDLTPMTPLLINFSSDVQLLGVTEQAIDDDEVRLTLYFQALREDIPAYTLRAALISEGQTSAGQTVAESRFIAPGGWFSSEWPPERIVRQDISLSIPPDASAENAHFILQVLGCESQINIGACEAPFALLSFDARGRPLGDAPEISIR